MHWSWLPPQSLYPTLLLSFVLTLWPLCCSSAYNALSLRYLHGWLPYFLSSILQCYLSLETLLQPHPPSSIGCIHICTYQHIPVNDPFSHIRHCTSLMEKIFFKIYIYRIFQSFCSFRWEKYHRWQQSNLFCFPWGRLLGPSGMILDTWCNQSAGVGVPCSQQKRSHPNTWQQQDLGEAGPRIHPVRPGYPKASCYFQLVRDLGTTGTLSL